MRRVDMCLRIDNPPSQPVFHLYGTDQNFARKQIKKFKKKNKVMYTLR